MTIEFRLKNPAKNTEIDTASDRFKLTAFGRGAECPGIALLPSRHGKTLGNVVIWRMVYEQAEVA